MIYTQQSPFPMGFFTRTLTGCLALQIVLTLCVLWFCLYIYTCGKAQLPIRDSKRLVIITITTVISKRWDEITSIIAPVLWEHY